MKVFDKFKVNFKFQNITETLKIYLLVLSIFSVFRLALFLTQYENVGEETSIGTVFQAFFMGVRFDLVVSSYILAIPFVLFTLREFITSLSSTVFNQIVFWFVFISFSIAFIVNGIDIPYFEQFFSRFSMNAFKWMDSPDFVFGMIFEEPRLWLFIIPVIGIVYLFYRLLKRIVFENREPQMRQKRFLHVSLSILFLGGIILSMRGRLDEKSPIRVGTAYFSSDPLLNQLGLNPNFTLLKSYMESRKEGNQPIALMSNEKAISKTQEFLDIEPIPGEFPLLRRENRNSDSARYKNIIVVLMESMSADKMGRHGNSHDITPFLDSLSYEGHYFEHAYSAGIHTFNGIYSTLFSYPALFKKHPMKETSIPYLHGMGTALKKLGYSTSYFTTHDSQFDNVEGFLRANDFDKVISKSDYPREKIKTTLGVADDYMFEFAMPVLDEIHAMEKPFFATFMTSSDHKPYYIPDYFSPKSTGIENQIVEYADFSLRKFIEMASEKEWFENTLFVFIADHGVAMNINYDVALAYNHVPLLFYGPKIIKEPKTFTRMAGQIDVFPSTLGLLNLPFDNYSLGINLFQKERPYMYFGVGDIYAVLNQHLLLIVRDDHHGLYWYQERDKNNHAENNKELVQEMKTYAEAQMQAYQYVLLNR